MTEDSTFVAAPVERGKFLSSRSKLRCSRPKIPCSNCREFVQQISLFKGFVRQEGGLLSEVPCIFPRIREFDSALISIRLTSVRRMDRIASGVSVGNAPEI